MYGICLILKNAPTYRGSFGTNGKRLFCKRLQEEASPSRRRAQEASYFSLDGKFTELVERSPSFAKAKGQASGEESLGSGISSYLIDSMDYLLGIRCLAILDNQDLTGLRPDEEEQEFVAHIENLTSKKLLQRINKERIDDFELALRGACSSTL